jgi:hypothetical protein
MVALEVSESGLLLEVKKSGLALVNFDKTVVFTELTVEGIKREFSKLHPVNPSVNTGVGAKFANGDFCLIAQEK